MDGYAGFRFADWQDGKVMPVAGTALAGQPFSGDIPAGACLHILALSAQVPAELDTVIIQNATAQTSEGGIVTQPPVSQPIFGIWAKKFVPACGAKSRFLSACPRITVTGNAGAAGSESAPSTESCDFRHW